MPGDAQAAQVMVIAKEPVPGRVKTRLTPPYTPRQAAQLAEAALADTLAAVGSVSVTRRVLALDGAPGRWLPPGFDVIGQRGAGLDERIAWALADLRAAWPAPVVLIGMDTPQVTPDLVAAAAEPLGCQSAIGPASGPGDRVALGLAVPVGDPCHADGGQQGGVHGGGPFGVAMTGPSSVLKSA